MGGFDYLNEFTYEFEDAFGAGVVGAIMAVYLLVWLFAMAVSVALYVFQSVGIYTIAKRRGIKKSWLTWIPFGNLWILGSISDQYQYVTKGKIKNKRKAMLGLSLAMMGAYILVFISGIMSGLLGSDLGAAALTILFVILAALAFFALAIWLTVLQYMALYDLYRSCDPENSVLFLVFSILFSVTMPFFIFACRKKDLGMPPRKQPAPVIPQTIEPEEDVEEGFAQPEEFEEE